MSILISELCERDVLEIDWETLAVDNSSVYGTYTGLSLDEAQVKAGRETKVRRMLEFQVYEEVSEEPARGKRIWNSAWLDSQRRPGLVRSRLVVNQVRGACKREDVFATTPSLAARRFIFVNLHRVVMAVVWACGMCLWHSSLRRLRTKCLSVHQRTCGRTRPSGNS